MSRLALSLHPFASAAPHPQLHEWIQRANGSCCLMVSGDHGPFPSEVVLSPQALRIGFASGAVDVPMPDAHVGARLVAGIRKHRQLIIVHQSTGGEAAHIDLAKISP